MLNVYLMEKWNCVGKLIGKMSMNKFKEMLGIGMMMLSDSFDRYGFVVLHGLMYIKEDVDRDWINDGIDNREE